MSRLQDLPEYVRLAGIPRIFGDTTLQHLEPKNDEQKQLKEKLEALIQGKCWAVTIIGSVGNGKTTFSTATVNTWNDDWNHTIEYNFMAYYRTQSQILTELKESIGNGEEAKTFRIYSNCPLLVIDELNKNMTEYGQESLQKILLERHANGKRTILAGNISQEDFKAMFDDHILSRLREGKTQVMSADDMRSRG